jgi:hypothetical protein
MVARMIVARLLLVVAMLLMPLGMTPATGADVHRPHAMAGMPMGHCDRDSPKHAAKGFAECTMACSAALPAMDFAPEAPPMIVCGPVRPGAAAILHGLHPDAATPPPKPA